MTSFNLGAALADYKSNSEVTVLDADTYTLEVISAAAGTAAKGPTIFPVFKVATGPLVGKRVLCGKLSFSEAALWKTFPIIRGFGITDDFIAQADSTPNPIKTIADALVGRVVDATVSVEEWDGSPRNRLNKVTISAGATAVAPPPPPAAAAQAAAPAAQAPPPPPPAAPAPANVPSF